MNENFYRPEALRVVQQIASEHFEVIYPYKIGGSVFSFQLVSPYDLDRKMSPYIILQKLAGEFRN